MHFHGIDLRILCSSPSPHLIQQAYKPLLEAQCCVAQFEARAKKSKRKQFKNCFVEISLLQEELL